MAGYVYRAYDESDRLLYVGCTVNVEGRMATHAESSPWHLFHSRLEVEEFATRELAAEAEVAAIATEHPRWNVRGRSDNHPDGQCYEVRTARWLAYELEVWRRYRTALSDRARLRREYAASTRVLRAIEAEAAVVRSGEVFADDLAGLTP